MERLPGEQELLDMITKNFSFGATMDQLIGVFDHKGTREVSVPQLLEVLVAHGEVHTFADLYKPGPKPQSQDLATPTRFEAELAAAAMTEYRFKCTEGHEFSVLSKELVKDDLECLVYKCWALADAQR